MTSLRLLVAVIVATLLQVRAQDTSSSSSSSWAPERPANMAQISALDVMCYTNKMTVTISFSEPFNGMIFSKGSYGQENCIYVPSNTAKLLYKFDIMYDRCGTKPDLQGKYYENTIVVQYEKDLIEFWDEAKRLRCEWANDYRQMTESMPAVRIDDIAVIELDFQGDNVDCWMEIQEGKGPWTSQVSGIVPIGSPLTLVVAVNDPSGDFDAMVRSCSAHDGVRQPLQLTDERGCVLRPKMFSSFKKTRPKDGGRATAITYAYFSAFKFPDTMDVHIQCKVVICRHGCPEPCSSDFNAQRIGERIGAPVASGQGYASRTGQRETEERPSTTPRQDEDEDREKDAPFPHGPRSMSGAKVRVKVRRSSDSERGPDQELRVSHTYRAISRTDLAFAPNVSDESISIYSGRRRESEHGICLSLYGFGAVFSTLSMFAVTAVLVAAVCCFQLKAAQRRCDAGPGHPADRTKVK